MGTARKLSDYQEKARKSCVALDSVFLIRNTFGDVALRNEILGLFKAQIDGLSRNLLLPMDGQAWHFVTHTLKGAAAAVGALDFASLAEDWARQTAPATIDQRQARVRELAEARTAFEAAAAKLPG
jgi:hypothetical protein